MVPLSLGRLTAGIVLAGVVAAILWLVLASTNGSSLALMLVVLPPLCLMLVVLIARFAAEAGSSEPTANDLEHLLSQKRSAGMRASSYLVWDHYIAAPAQAQLQ